MAELLELINLEQFHDKGNSFLFFPFIGSLFLLALHRFKYGFVGRADANEPLNSKLSFT